jgi:hypothetical protein
MGVFDAIKEKIGATRLGAADYFAARLAYDATPHDLKKSME